jgi:hypothetical protein
MEIITFYWAIIMQILVPPAAVDNAFAVRCVIQEVCGRKQER